MILAAVRIIDYSPTSGTMRFEWHKAVGPDIVVYTYNRTVPPPSPTLKTWWTWGLATIGHFPWEISEPGAYYLVISTTWGDARLDFEVTN
jgi:hypothetical protein